ncbi:Uncharacterized protein PECH_003403 [Penicillium ucsense]|uniref:WD repeat protein n=1 Tax=Penicillium ucsense TaxID=2839758 RepID=A0A8J8WMJ3_9EURO|nr:Uncharacterized protein PECM_000213 [Penicillium ucsense]KAF7739425.1 Uncharacterized protein PECH_003403 [Penicillium ucsense]
MSTPITNGADSGASDAATASQIDQHDSQRRNRRSTTAGGGAPSASTYNSPDAATQSSAIDPLSQHIIQRTNTQKSIPHKLLGRASSEAEAGSYGVNTSKSGGLQGQSGSILNDPKTKKKGASLLSRLIPGKKKKKQNQAPGAAEEEEASEPDTSRISIDKLSPIGLVPQHPGPAKYIRNRTYGKKVKEFNRVFLAQELFIGGTTSLQTADRRKSSSSSSPKDPQAGGAIWALSFSKDGKYLAAAGQDQKVRVWAVISTPEERGDVRHGEAPMLPTDQPPHFQAPVFHPIPSRVFEGHTGTVVDLSWSKNNFLLSSSMDKTVRLWHIGRSECLCTFLHTDFVTSVQFHPKDDRFFLAGSLDAKLRLWSIPDKNIAFVATVPDMITAVSFTPDGRYAIAGCSNGLISIHDTEGLKPTGQIHSRSLRGRNSRGNKITGIDTLVDPVDDPHGEIKLLVTSNDSRIRLYNFHERNVEVKFRGNENTCSQIRASFTDDGRHVICGSEDRKAYIWPVEARQNDGDKKAVEVLDTHSSIVTVAIAAPTSTRQILDLTDDPIYDMCNPPPVTVEGVDEQSQQSRLQSHASPEESLSSDGGRRSSEPRIALNRKEAHESSNYAARSRHCAGHIIVTADYSGKIKVLRQDCAYQKRRHENWSATFAISRRILRRSNSPRNSVASGGGKDSTHKSTSDRILSWRNSVAGHGRKSNDGSRQGSRTRTSSPHSRRRPNLLPRLSSRPSSLAPEESRSVMTPSAPPSPSEKTQDLDRQGDPPLIHEPSNENPEPDEKPVSSRDFIANNFSKENPLWLQGDHSYAFWNKITQGAMAIKERQSNKLQVPSRMTSRSERSASDATSHLSSDNASSVAGEEDILRCQQCQGSNFRAVKARDGSQRLMCAQCNLAIE